MLLLLNPKHCCEWPQYCVYCCFSNVILIWPPQGNSFMMCLLLERSGSAIEQHPRECAGNHGLLKDTSAGWLCHQSAWIQIVRLLTLVSRPSKKHKQFLHIIRLCPRIFKPSYRYVLISFNLIIPKSEVIIYEIISLTENLPTRHYLLSPVSDWKILYFEVVPFYFQLTLSFGCLFFSFQKW